MAVSLIFLVVFFGGIIFIIAAWGSYHTAKDVGTSEDDDERDKYVRLY